MTSNSIQPFTFEGTQVRTVTYETGQTWWVLADVVKALALTSTTRVAERLDSDGVSQTQVIDSLGREQTATIINESGLYEVILRSDKPEAKRFRKWVTADVLPSIRSHGAYMTPEVLQRSLLNPDYLIQLATRLKEEQEAREAAETLSAMQAQRLQIVEPKAKALDDFTSTAHSYNLTVSAQILSNGGKLVKQNALIKYLLEIGWVYRREGRLQAYSDRTSNGFLYARAYPSRTLDGVTKTFPPQVRITPKGLAALYKKIYNTTITEDKFEVAA